MRGYGGSLDYVTKMAASSGNRSIGQRCQFVFSSSSLFLIKVQIQSVRFKEPACCYVCHDEVIGKVENEVTTATGVHWVFNGPGRNIVREKPSLR